jgi:protein phosphatase
MRRRNNEDAVGYEYPTDPHQLKTYGALFIVADGVGGLPRGEEASRLAIDKLIKRYYEQDSAQAAAERLEQAIHQVNTDIYKELNREGGTTLVAAVILGDRLITASVGDSLIFRLRGDDLRRLGADDVLADDAAGDENGALTQAIGYRETVTVETLKTGLQPGDVLLMCSDGLTRYLVGAQLMRYARLQDPRDGVRRMINDANNAGGADNITVLLTKIHDDTDPETAIQHMNDRVVPVAIDDQPMYTPEVPGKPTTQVPQARAEAPPPKSPSTPAPIPRTGAPRDTQSAPSDRNWLAIAGFGVLLIGTAIVILSVLLTGENTATPTAPAPTALPTTAVPVTDENVVLPESTAEATPQATADTTIDEGDSIRLSDSVLTSVRVDDDSVASFVAAPDTPYIVQTIYRADEDDGATWYRLLDESAGQSGWIAADDLPAYTIVQDEE